MGTRRDTRMKGLRRKPKIKANEEIYVEKNEKAGRGGGNLQR